LARRILDFWRAAGFEITVEVVMVASGSPPTYGVRSDLVAGLPARAPAKKKGEAIMATGEDVEIKFGASLEGLTAAADKLEEEIAEPRGPLEVSSLGVAAAGELWIGMLDAVVALGMTLVARGWISREELAAVYQTAERQQAAQTPGVDHPARRLAVHAIAGFFAAQITADRPALRLVVDNGTPDPAGKIVYRGVSMVTAGRERRSAASYGYVSRVWNIFVRSRFCALVPLQEHAR
jgi:hypothetical protein